MKNKIIKKEINIKPSNKGVFDAIDLILKEAEKKGIKREDIFYVRDAVN